MNITFQTTYNCNLRCEYCFQPKHKNKVMKKEEAFAFIDEFFKYMTTGESKIFSVYITDKKLTDKMDLDFFRWRSFVISRINYFNYRILSR